jgi:hypothetical protein
VGKAQGSGKITRIIAPLFEKKYRGIPGGMYTFIAGMH